MRTSYCDPKRSRRSTLTPMRRLSLPVLVLPAAILMLAIAPASASASSCKLGSGQGLGPSYVTSLTVSGTSCTSGKRLVRAYYRCRKAAGGVKGRCTKPVLGYRCRETRHGIAIQFDARVTCTAGKRKVVHTYTQNT